MTGLTTLRQRIATRLGEIVAGATFPFSVALAEIGDGRQNPWAGRNEGEFPLALVWTPPAAEIRLDECMGERYLVTAPLTVAIARYCPTNLTPQEMADETAAAILAAINSDPFFDGAAAVFGVRVLSLTYDYDRPDLDWPGARFVAVTASIEAGLDVSATNP